MEFSRLSTKGEGEEEAMNPWNITVTLVIEVLCRRL
jgi:hypothetical protein